MRALQIIIIIASICLLAGCMTNRKSQCYPGGKCNEYQTYTRCGSYLKYECEDICKKCKAYEPSCYSCSACLESTPTTCLLENPHDGYYKK